MADKLYYSIGEVSSLLGVNASLLRYWETQFTSLRPHKNNKGTRYYTAGDIALLKQIYHLTRDCGYTLDGVRDQLRRSTPADDRAQLVDTLTQTREFLLQLKASL